jgi:hypothetical protein
MVRTPVKQLATITAALVLACATAGAQTKAKAPGKTKPPRAEKTHSFTGCIDQKGENYVLTGDRELHTIAILHGDGFNDDNFARDMGHKVIVEGSLAGDADPKTIRVKKVTKVSDSCAPE